MNDDYISIAVLKPEKELEYTEDNKFISETSDDSSKSPVEVDAEIIQPITIDTETLIENDILTEKTLCTVLCNLSEDNREKYKDKVVFIESIPVEKQKEFIKCFKTNNKDIINTTLEIIMNDYSKNKTEIINPPTTVVKDNIFDNNDDNTMELFNYAYHLAETRYFDSIKDYGKNRSHTTKHQPTNKVKKKARKNNRRAKRHNR